MTEIEGREIAVNGYGPFQQQKPLKFTAGTGAAQICSTNGATHDIAIVVILGLWEQFGVIQSAISLDPYFDGQPSIGSKPDFFISEARSRVLKSCRRFLHDKIAKQFLSIFPIQSAKDYVDGYYSIADRIRRNCLYDGDGIVRPNLIPAAQSAWF